MTLQTYNYIKAQLNEVHERIQAAPVSNDRTTEDAMVILEKLTMAIQDLLNATREGK